MAFTEKVVRCSIIWTKKKNESSSAAYEAEVSDMNMNALRLTGRFHADIKNKRQGERDGGRRTRRGHGGGGGRWGMINITRSAVTQYFGKNPV